MKAVDAYNNWGIGMTQVITAIFENGAFTPAQLWTCLNILRYV